MMQRTSSFRVPPYAITRGRTRSEVKLAIESLLTVTNEGKSVSLTHEKKRILELCQQPQSVAEVSALLKIPLQVAKILSGDLITSGYLTTGSLATESKDDRPDLQLLNRVLDGLQSL